MLIKVIGTENSLHVFLELHSFVLTIWLWLSFVRYEVQDLNVVDILPQQVVLSEAYMQIFEMQS